MELSSSLYLPLMESSYDEQCQYDFDTLELRVRHMCISWRHITCDVCTRRSLDFKTVPHEFRNLEERLEHYISAHYACQICSTPERIKRLATEDFLRNHMYTHFACLLCEHITTFNDLDELERHHLNFHHACIICSSKDIIIKFDNEATLLFHMEDTHHACVFRGSSNNPGSGCKAPVFGNDKGLRQHYIEAHLGCHYCSIKNFHNERERDDHHDSEHPSFKREKPQQPPPPKPKSKNPFHCKSCNDNLAGFPQHEDLLSHRRKAHGVINCGDPTCVRPTRINWPRWQRVHMEFCHHPNPCNDFVSKTPNNNCPICLVPCKTPAFMLHHHKTKHPCRECSEYIAHYLTLQTEHIIQHHGPPKAKSKPHPSPSSSTPRKPLDIYAILDLNPHSSHEEAKKVAKRRRIETHPDRLVRAGMGEAEKVSIDERAKLVGWAADVVCDAGRRKAYDREAGV